MLHGIPQKLGRERCPPNKEVALRRPLLCCQTLCGKAAHKKSLLETSRKDCGPESRITSIRTLARQWSKVPRTREPSKPTIQVCPGRTCANGERFEQGMRSGVNTTWEHYTGIKEGSGVKSPNKRGCRVKALCAPFL